MGRLFGFLGALASAAVLAAGCPDRPVTVGVVAPLTGPSAAYAEPVVRGIELAHRELSGDPAAPHPIVLEIRDSESDGARAAELLRELYEDGVFIALGGVTSSEARAMVAVAEDESRVLISPSATWAGLTGVSPQFYRVAASDFREGAKMGNFVAQEMNVRRAAVLAPESPFSEQIGEVFESELERYGGEVVAVVEYPPAAADPRDVVTRTLAAEPEAVYLTGDSADVGDLVAALRAGGFGGRILTTQAFAASGALERAGAAAEGVILTRALFDPEADDPRVRRFVEAYRAEHGTAPGFLAAQGYDAMMVVAAVLRPGEVASARDFQKELRTLRDFVGVGGPVQLDEKGDVSRFPRVYMIEGGALIDFETVLDRKNAILEQLDDLRRREREAAARAGRAAGGG